MSEFSCPNCSAELTSAGDIEYCEFCGYYRLNECSKHSESDIDVHFYNMIDCNKAIIYESDIVNVKNWSDSSVCLEMIYNYYPRIRYRVYPQLSFQLRYNWDNSNNEEFFLIVETEEVKQFPYIIIKTVYEDIILIEPETHDNKLVFQLSPANFLEICFSQPEALMIYTNLLTDPELPPLFDEFIHYCRRFYNQCISHTEYIYTIRKHLISDTAYE